MVLAVGNCTAMDSIWIYRISARIYLLCGAINGPFKIRTGKVVDKIKKYLIDLTNDQLLGYVHDAEAIDDYKRAAREILNERGYYLNEKGAIMDANTIKMALMGLTNQELLETVLSGNNESEVVKQIAAMILKERGWRGTMVGEHGEEFTNNFDEAFGIGKNVPQQSLRSRLYEILNTKIIFYVIGFFDGILVFLALQYLLGR